MMFLRGPGASQIPLRPAMTKDPEEVARRAAAVLLHAAWQAWQAQHRVARQAEHMAAAKTRLLVEGTWAGWRSALPCFRAERHKTAVRAGRRGGVRVVTSVLEALEKRMVP